jgi:hypothetical protein
MTDNLNINPRLLTFLIFVLLVVIMLMFSGCKSATGHLRQAEKHINKAKENGAKVSNDSIFVEVPITVTAIKDSIVLETHTDTLRIVELCKEVISTPKAIKSLQSEIRPIVEVDTVYQLEFISKGAKINIPIHVRISDKNQVFSYLITSPGIKVDLPLIVPCQTVKSGHTKWELIISAIIALIIGIVIGRVIRCKSI